MRVAGGRHIERERDESGGRETHRERGMRAVGGRY